MAAERHRRVGVSCRQVLREGELLAEGRPGSRQIRLAALGRDDLAGRRGDAVEVRGPHGHQAIVVDEDRVGGRHDDVGKGRPIERVGRSRVLAAWTRRQRPEAEHWQTDPAELRRVAVETPDDDRRDPRGRALERDEIADAALVQPALVVDDEDAPAGSFADALQGLEEDIDRSDVADWQGAPGYDGTRDHRDEPDRSQPEIEAMTNDGVGDSGSREGRFHAASIGGCGLEVISWYPRPNGLSSLAMTALDTTIRIGRAAEMLGVTVDTLRRWADDGRLKTIRSDGGQRLVPIDEVTRLIGDRRRAATDRPIVAQSARNRFAGIVTRIDKDRVAAVVEILAGPHRLVSLMTAEAVDELHLKIGDEAVAVVKSTNVIVEIPSGRESRP